MRLRRSERGASLVIVIVMISVFGLMLAAVGTQGQAGVMANAGVRKERVDQYAASGAMDGAINYLRDDLTSGREGLACPSFSTDSVNGTVAVVCTPQAGSGAVQQAANAPAYAFLTTRGLAGGYPTGTGVSVTSGGTLMVNGAVYSNSTIAVTGMNASSNAVGAFGACSGTITANPLACSTGSYVSDPGGAFNVEPTSPNTWASPMTTIPAAAPAPTCNGTNKVATMQPGSYFSYSAMSTGLGSCEVIWMRPGSYYFDWGVGSSSSTLWTITKKVVGGTPLGWSPTASEQPSVTIPGACDQTQPGVHLVFATTSRITVSGSANVEFCASPSSTTQQVVAYGRKTTQTVSLQSPPAYNPTAAGSSTPSALTTPFADVQTIDGVTNTATITGSGAIATTILTGYGLSAIPAGSVLNTVKVKLAHAESNSTTDRVTVAAGSKTLCSSISVSTHSSLSSDTVSCPSSQVLLTPANAQVTFTATRPTSEGSTDVTIDGIQLLITYTPPGFRAQTTGTVLFTMSPGSSKGELYLQGTLYAPFASVTINYVNNSEAAFNRGVVIASFTGSNVPSSQTVSAFSLPPPSAYADRVVALVATMGGQRKLRAVVRFDDGGGSTPGQSVAVSSWTAVN